MVQAGGPYIEDPRQANSTGKAWEGHQWEKSAGLGVWLGLVGDSLSERVMEVPVTPWSRGVLVLA